MILALFGALAAAFCYGVGSVLQAIGARRTAGSAHLDPGLFVRLARSAPFIIGLGLDVVGAVLSILALRRLPLFVVQAAIASSLAVTAVVASRAFAVRLRRPEWLAIGAVAVGLVALAAAAGPEGPPHTSLAVRVGLLVGVLVVGGLAVVGGRLQGGAGAAALGGLAGVAYGLANTSARVIESLSLPQLLRNPATAATIAGAVLGVLLFATALQRGSVTGATGALTAAETILPAMFGVAVLGERPRSGWAALAILGFVLAVGGAGALSRFGELETPATPGTGSRPGRSR